MDLNKLYKLRKILHSEPELSGNEKNTSKKIIDFISNLTPDKIIKNLGGKGLAFIFNGSEKGPTLLFRAELDALPIQELNNFAHRSKYLNISHKCGHDGHMTILAGLAQKLSKSNLRKGRVVLLFQPAEETGEGAYKVLTDKKFGQIKPDYVFALHNLPGYPLNSIILRKKNFAASSKGMIIKLRGKTSHAAEPEKGINPSIAAAKIIDKFSRLTEDMNELKDFALVTIIHVNIGKRAFGTSPGYAEVLATFRAYNNNDMNLMTTEMEKFIKFTAKKERLISEISYTEEFPATINNPEGVKVLTHSAKQLGLKTIHVRRPFPWSEDFGHFTNKFKGTLFGIGAGINHPKLHNPDYDFPDELIIVGTEMMYSVIKNITNRT